MPRTNTTAFQSFTRSGSVTYELPNPALVPTDIIDPTEETLQESQSPSTAVTIRIPSFSSWSSGLHYHATHTEYLRVLSGAALVTTISMTGRSTKPCTKADGPIRIDRFVIHEWGRASDKGEEVVVQEWTDPADGAKEVFFRNLNSVILDVDRILEGVLILLPKDWLIEWQILVICAGMDNFPVFTQSLGAGVAMRIFGKIVLWLVALTGALFGLKPWYEDYTPERLRPSTKKAV